MFSRQFSFKPIQAKAIPGLHTLWRRPLEGYGNPFALSCDAHTKEAAPEGAASIPLGQAPVYSAASPFFDRSSPVC